MSFCCFWCYVETFCHKHFVVVSHDQQTPPLTTSSKCHNLPRSGGTVLITPSRSQRCQHAMETDISRDRDFCLPHLHSAPPLGASHWNIAMMFGMENLEWCGYPMVKNCWRYVYSFRQNVRTCQKNRRTDTAWRHKPRAHSFARQKLTE